jgi:hypothetical protein
MRYTRDCKWTEVDPFNVDGIGFRMTYADVVRTLQEHHPTGQVTSKDDGPCAQDLIAAARASATPSGSGCVSEVNFSDKRGDGESYSLAVRFVENFPEQPSTMIAWSIRYNYYPGSKPYDRNNILTSIVAKYGRPDTCAGNDCENIASWGAMYPSWRSSSNKYKVLDMDIRPEGFRNISLNLNLQDENLTIRKTQAVNQAVQSSRVPAAPKF